MRDASSLQVGLLAVLAFAYILLDQWAFRCHRVATGLLRRDRDSASQDPVLFSKLMPTQYVAAIWFARILWITGAVVAWRSWGWIGVAVVVAYVFVLSSPIDAISPWPSYAKLLGLIRSRIQSGAVGVDGVFLLASLSQIEEEMSRGTHFEAATTGVWLSRAEDAAARDVEREVAARRHERQAVSSQVDVTPQPLRGEEEQE